MTLPCLLANSKSIINCVLSLLAFVPNLVPLGHRFNAFKANKKTAPLCISRKVSFVSYCRATCGSRISKAYNHKTPLWPIGDHMLNVPNTPVESLFVPSAGSLHPQHPRHHQPHLDWALIRWQLGVARGCFHDGWF